MQRESAEFRVQIVEVVVYVVEKLVYFLLFFFVFFDISDVFVHFREESPFGNGVIVVEFFVFLSTIANVYYSFMLEQYFGFFSFSGGFVLIGGVVEISIRVFFLLDINS